MIRQVGDEQSTWADFPAKFEAGTPPLAEAVGLAAAIDYLHTIGMDRIELHERELMAYALALLQQTPDVTIYPPLDCNQKTAVLSFNIGDAHPHDVAQILDFEGVAVRAGHHCAQPLMRALGVQATIRLSFSLYNLSSEIDQLAQGLRKVREIF
jgi:cysteine desulfurase/selenocysteine lyase